jgi:penicillin-binding protein 1C
MKRLRMSEETAGCTLEEECARPRAQQRETANKPWKTWLRRDSPNLLRPGTGAVRRRPSCGLGRNAWWKIITRLLLAGLGAMLLLTLLGPVLVSFVPLPPALFLPPPPTVEWLDRNGEPLRLTRDGDRPFQQLASLPEIPQALVSATLAAEDSRFWSHHGVDWRADLRAAWQLIWNRRIISGASTITQQTIKLGASRPRTVKTKIIETLQALRLEQVWDKQRILTEYLNRVDYGNYNRGCVAAARFYFAKPPRDLSAAECALLAGLPQSPARLNPRAHFAAARRRQVWILTRMSAEGWLTGDEFRRAWREPLRLARGGRAFAAPHFVDLLLEQGGVAAGSPVVRTTLDLPLNRFAGQTLRRRLDALQAEHAGEGAIVVIENQTGNVLALVGSRDYFSARAGQVNGAWAPRSTGSALKPFLYWLAFAKGATPASIVADVPTDFATSTGLFSPVNYDRHCYGPERYRMALANSLNISAVKVLDSVGGAAPLLDLLRRCRLSTLTQADDHYGLGLAIGNAEARLLELANAYACLARLGVCLPYRLAPSAPGQNAGVRVGDADAAWLIADILSDNDARAAAFGPESSLRFDFPVACKTGTSSDFRDNWAFGYTPEFTVGVWVGNFDGSPMRHISGVTGAAPILHDLFAYLHDHCGTSWYARPAGIVERGIDPLTGKLSSRPDAVNEKFTEHLPPPASEMTDYDIAGRVRLGPEYRDWLAGADNWLAGRAVLRDTAPGLRVTFPLSGAILFLDPDLPDHGRQLYLSAEGSDQAEWSSDSLECRQQGGRSVALLALGRHELTVRDPQTGATRQTWIEVKER